LSVLGLCSGGFVYEGKTFDISCACTYTPDWVNETLKIAIEAKGEWIFSRDSRLRFNDAMSRYPEWTFIWARRRTQGKKGKRWEIEVYGA